MLSEIEYDPMKVTLFPADFTKYMKGMRGKSFSIFYDIVFNHHRQDGRRQIPLTIEDILNKLSVRRATLLKWLNHFVKIKYIALENEQIKLLVMTERAREDLEVN